MEVVTDPETLIEDDSLVLLFGDTPKTRILRELLSTRTSVVNPATLVERAHVSRQSWYRHRDDLLESGIVVEAGHAGNSPLYMLAENDERVEWLQKLYDWTNNRRNSRNM